ncbi:hypothetical protein M433DRAFT_148429 [Acidomyces richmondensis BFW]|nr:hypothetical protein M433DRAFT_148429 [Acidomyces richmondensis BFW]
MPKALPRGYEHLTFPHKIMMWPAIYLHLINSGIPAASDLHFVLQEGTTWFVSKELAKHPSPLAWNVSLPCCAVNNTNEGSPSNVSFPTLTVQKIQMYCDAYFNTFNVLHPLLNRATFMDKTVSRLLRVGYGDGDASSIIALLVYALGQVAVEGVFGNPVSVVEGRPSGFRGGTVDQPPGLALFNEARRRLGFISTQCSLENVQIMLLQAIYYEATARHLDFWRAIVSASMACQVLIRCQPVDWTSPMGDLIKRAYWTCVLSEDLYHLDLDLPQSGVQRMEDEVPLPSFESDSSLDHSHYQYHFLAMIALRRLISRIHAVIHECDDGAVDEYGGPPVAVIREMARQLDGWRALLPRPLQWSDSDKFDFPATDPLVRRPNEPLFSIDQGSIPIGHKHNLDIVCAQLRTRFYYARFMMYRPFVYKALHFPELMTADDAACCALAIKSACLWPLAMAPPKNKKRLVPHLFAWTQNFMAILLVLRMCAVNKCLKAVVEEQGVVGWKEIEQSVACMLEWVKDMRQVDGIAEWSWQILEPLYGVKVRRDDGLVGDRGL